jgi:hypothetical protein
MSVEYIFIVISIAVVALTFVVLLVFGIRNLARGKQSIFSVAAIVAPFVIFGICAAILGGEMAKSALYTVFVMSALAIAGLLYSGFRGLTG